MQTITDPPACRAAILEARQAGLRVGFVPTMGALHRGHLSLIERARSECDQVAVSIFVNPMQFAPHEDLEKYPRPIEADLALCRRVGVSLVFAPRVEAMYPPGFATSIRVARLTEGLCGPFRPSHFDGVATVVARLFQLVPADRAYFGEKDYQQLAVIRRMVEDLCLPVTIVGCPTVRDHDGLALSSRNAYLSEADRARAAVLSRSLFHAADRANRGERNAESLIRDIREKLTAEGIRDVDYVEIVDAETLVPLKVVDRPARICLAVRLGGCRLIDNIAVDAPGCGS